LILLSAPSNKTRESTDMPPANIQKFIEDATERLKNASDQLQRRACQLSPSRMQEATDANATPSNRFQDLEVLIHAAVQQLQRVEVNPSQLLQSIAAPEFPASTSRARTARYAVPRSRFVSTFGADELLTIARWL